MAENIEEARKKLDPKYYLDELNAVCVRYSEKILEMSLENKQDEDIKFDENGCFNSTEIVIKKLKKKINKDFSKAGIFTKEEKLDYINKWLYETISRKIEDLPGFFVIFFIEQFGADTNKVNEETGKTPIDYAIELSRTDDRFDIRIIDYLSSKQLESISEIFDRKDEQQILL